MVEERASVLDNVFHALSHPSRREMLRRLGAGEQNLSEMAAPFRISFAAASKHVQVLERAGLVRREVRGREHVCRLVAAPLRDAAAWTERFRAHWESSFARPDAVVAELKADEKEAVRRRRTGSEKRKKKEVRHGRGK